MGATRWGPAGGVHNSLRGNALRRLPCLASVRCSPGCCSQTAHTHRRKRNRTNGLHCTVADRLKLAPLVGKMP